MSATTRLAPFQFDIESARAEYDDKRWVHARGGVSGDLMEAITSQVADLIGSATHELENWRYPDKKEQFLWELPDGLDIEDLCTAVALTTGMDPTRTVLSERHLKVYSATAPETPPPHKDRSASTVTVGIGIDIPIESRLVLWPDVDSTYNPYPTAAEWRDSRDTNELPEVVTAGVDPVEIDMRRGDVVLFAGAEIYHERHQPAKTTVLYLKFNDLALDPLGEDPRTIDIEDRSRAVEAGGIAADHVVSVSPRVIGLRTDELFPNLGSVSSVRIFGDAEGTELSPSEAATLRTLAQGGPRTVADVPGSAADLERLLRLGFVVVS